MHLKKCRAHCVPPPVINRVKHWHRLQLKLPDIKADEHTQYGGVVSGVPKHDDLELSHLINSQRAPLESHELSIKYYMDIDPSINSLLI